MRLTLRTMLAYLDEILEPADQQEIGQKIEESEFASDLVRRIRDAVQKLRLGAPALVGRGIDPDPNTVAEYLDNSLPAERVPEFERACLDSDVYLAEVAACHQILTLVLGHPAEVEPDSRQRMYGALADARTLEGQGVAVAVETPAADETAAAAAPDLGIGGTHGPARAARPKPQIPDYLRESSGSVLRRYAVAALVVVALLGGVTLTVVGPGRFLRDLVGKSDQIAATDSVAPGDQRGVASTPADATVDGGAAAGRLPPAPEPQPAPVATDPDSAPPTAETSDMAPEPPHPGTGSGTDLGPSAEPADQPPTSPEQAAGANRLDQRPADTVVDATDPGPAIPQPADPGVGQLEPSPPPAAAPAEPVATADDADAQSAAPATVGAGPAPPDPAPPSAHQTPDGIMGPNDAVQQPGPSTEPELAIYSNSEVLVRYDPHTGQWWRLPPRAPIAADEKLLALPNFRPRVTLTSGSGITLEMVGPAVVTPNAPDADGAPGIELLYGRIILMNIGGADNRCRLVLGAGQHQVQFGDVGATLAIELGHRHTAGADPETVPAPVVVHLFATSGQLHWRGTSAEPGTDMTAPGQWELSDGRLRRVADSGPSPVWIDEGAPHGIELRAARSLNEELLRDRPVGLVLQELVEGQRSGRRLEVRSLAARSSIHVGQFEPFVESLNDPEQRTWWPLLIESLEDALTLGPEVAAEIRRACQRQRGAEAGDKLFRLLWGFDTDELRTGADKQLVEYLQHDQLDFRVLALWNLIHLTGQGNPHRLLDPKASRQQLVRLWKERLEQGRIAPKAAGP